MAKRLTARSLLENNRDAAAQLVADAGLDKWTRQKYDLQQTADSFGSYLSSGKFTTADTDSYRTKANQAISDLDAEMSRYGKSSNRYKQLDSYRQYYQSALNDFDRLDVGTKMQDYIGDTKTWRSQEDYNLQKQSLQDSLAALDAEMEKIEDKNSADYKSLQSWRDWYASYEDALNRRADWDKRFTDADDFAAYDNSTNYQHVADVRRTIKEKQDELKALDPSLENATAQDIDRRIQALQSQMNDLQLYGAPADVQNAQAQLTALQQAKETIGNLDAMRTELGRLEQYGGENILRNYGGSYDPNFNYEAKLDELQAALGKAEEGSDKYEEIAAQIRAIAGPNGDGTNANGLYDENTWYGRYVMDHFDLEAAQKRIDEIDKELEDLGLPKDRWLGQFIAGGQLSEGEIGYNPDGTVEVGAESDPHVMELRREKTELTQKMNSSERQQGRSKIETSKQKLSPEELAALTEAGKGQVDATGKFYSGKDGVKSLGVLRDLGKEFGDSDTDKYYAARAQELLDTVYAAIGAEKLGIDIGYSVEEALNAYEAQINDIAGYRLASEVNRTESDFVRWNRQVFGQGGLVGGAISNIQNLPDLFTDEYRPESRTQSMIAHTGEMMGDQYDKLVLPGGKNLAQTIHEAAVTTGNMLPGMALSAAVTALAGPAGLSATGAALAGKIAGAFEMGLTSGGQSYQQMLGMGYDAADARAYGTAMGAAEAGTQYLLGGIGKLGGVTEDMVLNLTKRVGNGILRAAAETAIHDVSEISEELLQNRIESYLQYSLFDQGNAPKFFEMTEDDWYTVVVTALSTTAMEGPGVAINSYRNNQLGLLASGQKTYSDAKTKGLMSAKLNKQEKARRALASEIGKAMQSDEALSYTLKAIGSGMEQGTAAYELATGMESGKVPANARNLGELFGAILSETTTEDGKHLDYDKFMAQTIGGAIKYNEIKRAEQAEGDTEKALNDAGQTLAEVRASNPGAAVLNKTASALSTQFGADPVKAVETAAVINKIRNGTAISSREMEQITGSSAEAKAARAYLAQQAGGENISVTADAAVTEAMVNELIKTNREQKKLVAEQTKAEILAAATEAGDAAEVNRAAAGATTKITAEDVKALQGAKRGVQEAERAAEIAKTRKQTVNDMSFEQMAEQAGTAEGMILGAADAQMVKDLQSQNAELQKTVDELSAVKMPSRAQASQLSAARQQMAENNARIETIMRTAADEIQKRRAEAGSEQAEEKTEEPPKKKGKKAIPPKQRGEETVVMPNGSTMTRAEFNGTDEEWNNMVAQSGGSVMEESNEQTTDNDQGRNALGGQRDGAADQERGDRPEQGSDAGGNRSRGGLLALDGSAVAEVDSDATLTDGSNVSSLEEGYPGIRKFTDGLMESGFKRVTYVTDGGIYNAIGDRVPAVYSNRELFLDLDFPSSYYDYQGTADHERLHLKLDLYRQHFGDTEARAFVTAALQDILSRDTYEDAFRKYWKRYAPVYLKNNDKMTVMHMVNEEMLCDMIGGIENFGAELDIFQEDAENFLDASKFDSVTRNLAEDPSVNPGEVVTEAVDVNAMPHNSTEVVLTSDAETTEELLTDSVNPDGEVVATTSDTGQGVFSLRTYDEGGKAALDKFLKKQVKKNSLTQTEADEIRQQMDALYTVCKSYDNGTYGPFSAWSNATVVEIDGRPVFSVVKANGEYKLNLDFSLVCKKRRALDAVFNEMISRGTMNKIVGDKAFLEMGPASIAQINNIIREHGFETACALCFVDSKRFRQAMIADAFVQMYNAQVLSLVDGVKDKRPTFFNYGGDQKLAAWQEGKTGIETLADFELNWSRINQILNDPKRAPHGRSSGTVEWKIANHLKNNPSARKLASRGDFMSTAGFDALNANNPKLLSLYNSSKGAGGPKAAQSDVQYLNDVINRVGFNAKAAYEVGGVRIQSFSDYVGRLVFDYVQMMGDLAAKKLPAHAYTKEFLFAQQFGLTGVKINMSLVPRVLDDGIAPGLDKDGNYAWMDGQSFGSTVYDNNGKRMTAAEGFELAIQIQNADGYSKNCGTIAVGVSREHILKMLDDPNIRMVIPYHRSGINHLVAAMNQIDRYTDYTDTQNTRKKKYSENGALYDPATGKRFDWIKLDTKNGDKDFNWNSALQRLEREGKGAREAAEEYKTWCAERGYDPKFSEFAYHPNYYKVLEDFTAYDRDGTTPAPLGAVQMNFPTKDNAFGSMEDLIKSGLEEDAMLQAKQEAGVVSIVDEIEATMPMWERQLQEQGEEFAIESGRRSLERTQMRDSTVRNSIQAAEIELTRDPIEEAEEGATTTRYSLRQEPAPKKTQWGFKLMTVDENGLPHAMFIDAAAPYEYGVWYNADSPKLENLLHLEPGYAYLVDADDNADMATRKPIRKVNGSFRGLPSKAEVNQATTDGKRWMVIDKYADGSVNAQNVGINGSGGISTFALRPGIHAVDIPSMAHIGAKSEGSKKIDTRRPNQRWFLIEYPVDNDYNQEAYGHRTKDIREHLPENGWYSFQTNSGAEARQHWFITGGMKIVGAVSEADIRKFAKDRGFEEDLPWKQGKVYSEDDAINLDEYIRTTDAMPTPSKSEMRQRIEAERKQTKPVIPAKNAPKKQAAKTEKPTAEPRYSIQGEPATKQQAQTYYSQQDTEVNDWAPEFYSKMQRTIEDWTGGNGKPMGAKMAANQVVNWLKGKGVKAEEIKWSGIVPYLDGKKTVTKDELLGVMAENEIKIETKVLEGGFKGKYEVLYDWESHDLTMDEIYELVDEIADEEGIDPNDIVVSPSPTNGKVYVYRMDIGQRLFTADPITEGDVHWQDYSLPDGENYREILFKQPGNDYTNTAMQVHWGENETGVLAHARVQDFDAREDASRVLLIEEIQSDLHNAGASRPGPRNTQGLTREHDPAGFIEKGERAELQRLLKKSQDDDLTDEEEQQYRVLSRKYLGDKRSAYIKAIEDRRAIEDTAFRLEGTVKNILMGVGYTQYTDGSRIQNWVRGEQEHLLHDSNWRGESLAQARVMENLNQEEKAQLAEVRAAFKAVRDASEDLVVANRNAADAPPDVPFAGSSDTYHEYVMKHLLRLAAEGDYDRLAWTTAQQQSARWSDDFAEGYKIEYDQNIPKFMSKYVKQWGGKVGTTTLDNGEKVWSVDITPEMRDSVLTKGQPLFSVQDGADSLYPEGTLQRDILDVLRTGSAADLSAWTNEQMAKHEDALENAKIKAPAIPSKGFVPKVTPSERDALNRTLQAAIDRYGTMKPSEKSNGFVLPAKNQKGQNLRRGLQNIGSAKNLTKDAQDQALRFTLTNAAATYVPDSNEKLINNAKDDIADMGLEHSLTTFRHNASKVNLGTKGILQNIALGEQLLIETAHNGDMASFIDVLSSVAELGTTVGKSLQAFRLLKQSGPIGQLYYVQKAVDRLNKQNEERMKRGKFKEIVVNDDLAKAVINAQEGKERDKAMDALIADIASQAPVTLRDRWNAWRYLAMLGNARTHIRNVVGNAVFAPLRYVKDVMAAGGEFLATKAGLMEEEDRTKALTVSRELRDFALSDADVMQKELQGNGKYNPAQEILQARKLLPGFLNTLSKANGNALEKEDWWFLRGAYARALSQQLSHLGYSVEEMQTTVEGQEALNRARKNAILEAQKATYRDFVAAASWLNRGKQLTGAAGTIVSIGLEGVLPFTKTPINILRRGVEYSPLGIAKGIGTILSGVKNGNLDVAEAIDQLAAGLTGTGVAVLGLLLARMGVLRGKKGDDDEENFDKMQGMQDYSLQIGDQSFTIDWAAPTALPLFTGAAVAQLLEESGEDGLQAKDIWNGIMMIAEPMTSLSMLDGLNKLIESTAYASGNEKIATIATQATTSYLGQAFPTILGQVARSIDGTRRSTYVDKNSPIPAAGQRFIQTSVQGKIPGWENAKVPYIDAWGRTSEPSSKVLNGIENFFAPWYRNTKQVTDVDEELKDLYSKTKADILPSVPQKYFSVGGEKKYLTADEWVSYATDVGQTKYDLMTQLISDPRYLALDDTKKAKVIKDYIYKYAGAVGKFHADPNYDIHGTGVWIEEAEAAATDYERFERIWQQIEKTLKD